MSSGRSGGNSSPPTCHTRSRPARSFRPYSPRSRRTRPGTSFAAASDVNTWPPWPRAMILAVRFNVGPDSPRPARPRCRCGPPSGPSRRPPRPTVPSPARLSRDRGGDGVVGCPERRGEGISGGREHDAAALTDRRRGRISSWRTSADLIASGWSCHSRVEPSMSVNRNVTVPVAAPIHRHSIAPVVHQGGAVLRG